MPNLYTQYSYVPSQVHRPQNGLLCLLPFNFDTVIFTTLFVYLHFTRICPLGFCYDLRSYTPTYRRVSTTGSLIYTIACAILSSQYPWWPNELGSPPYGVLNLLHKTWIGVLLYNFFEKLLWRAISEVSLSYLHGIATCIFWLATKVNLDLSTLTHISVIHDVLKSDVAHRCLLVLIALYALIRVLNRNGLISRLQGNMLKSTFNLPDESVQYSFKAASFPVINPQWVPLREQDILKQKRKDMYGDMVTDNETLQYQHKQQNAHIKSQGHPSSSIRYVTELQGNTGKLVKGSYVIENSKGIFSSNNYSNQCNNGGIYENSRNSDNLYNTYSDNTFVSSDDHNSSFHDVHDSQCDIKQQNDKYQSVDFNNVGTSSQATTPETRYKRSIHYFKTRNTNFKESKKHDDYHYNESYNNQVNKICYVSSNGSSDSSIVKEHNAQYLIDEPETSLLRNGQDQRTKQFKIPKNFSSYSPDLFKLSDPSHKLAYQKKSYNDNLDQQPTSMLWEEESNTENNIVENTFPVVSVIYKDAGETSTSLKLYPIDDRNEGDNKKFKIKNKQKRQRVKFKQTNSKNHNSMKNNKS